MRSRKKKREKLAIPLPEAIDGQHWKIHRSPSVRIAGVEHRHGQMIVPLGESQVERLVRLHEMTHVKITPRDELQVALGELPESILQLCEDARVHRQMHKLGFPVKDLEGVVSDMEIRHMARSAHPAELAALAAAMYATGEAERLAEALPTDERRAIYKYGRKLCENVFWQEDHLVPFSSVVSMAKEIIEALGDPGAPEEKQPTALPAKRLPALADFERDMNGVPTKFKPGTPPRDTNDKVHGAGDWMEMRMEEPPLPLRLPGEMRGRRKKVPEQRGRRLHRIGRLYHDGRVFSHKPPTKGGGAVLIDTSGSMKLSRDDVLRLCAAYPGGVIGAYSGDSHKDGEYGILRVIARKGRRVPDDQISPPGGGNSVDGPALDWLAKQPGPRYWISDAGVYGGAEGLRYCEQVCRRANIERVDNAWEIVGKVV
jgi:hypothetical protein